MQATKSARARTPLVRGRSQAAHQAVTLGRLIAAERHRQELTQHQLAIAVGCPDDMIGHVERDRRGYWSKMREILEVLSKRAEKGWLKTCTEILMGEADALVWNESDPIRRLMIAERLRSSGDRAADISTSSLLDPIVGSDAELKEPQLGTSRAA